MGSHLFPEIFQGTGMFNSEKREIKELAWWLSKNIQRVNRWKIGIDTGLGLYGSGEENFERWNFQSGRSWLVLMKDFLISRNSQQWDKFSVTYWVLEDVWNSTKCLMVVLTDGMGWEIEASKFHGLVHIYNPIIQVVFDKSPWSNDWTSWIFSISIKESKQK